MSSKIPSIFTWRIFNVEHILHGGSWISSPYQFRTSKCSLHEYQQFFSLTGKLAELIATVDSLPKQSHDLLATCLEDHHFEEHDDDPGEDASIVRNDWQVVQARTNVSQQSHHEDEHNCQNKLVIREV